MDYVTDQHDYSFRPIEAWPVDAAVVYNPTDRAALLLGSLKAACSLEDIVETTSLKVTVVVTMRAQEMQITGAPTDWAKHFQEQDVFHIQCHLEDTTLKPTRHIGLSRFRTWWLPVCDSGKSSATSYGNSPCWRSPGTNPCTCSFTALVASIGARGFCALGSLSRTSTPHWKPCSCYFKKDQRCVLGAIDPMSWKRCGAWKVCARNGRETSAQHAETSLCRGSSVEAVRDETATSSLRRRDPQLPEKGT